jgi:hypothetical protein
MNYEIVKHVDPYYKDVEGFDLIVDDHVQAVLRQKGSNVNLVFQMRGPLDIEQARPIIIGLLDLLVHHDKMASKRGKS